MINPTDGLQSVTDTLQAVDVINGGAGVDKLNVVSASGDMTRTKLPTISNLEIINASSLANLNVDVSKVSGLTNLNVTKTLGYVEAVASAATNVNVTVDGATTQEVRVEGGKDVTVAVTNMGNNDIYIGLGASNAPVGAVTISATGAAASNGIDVGMGNILVEGGKTVNVTQKATSDASAIVVGPFGVTHTQGNVNITAGVLTTDVTVKQDANVAAVSGTVAVAGVMPVASVKFVAMAVGQTVEIGGLTFRAEKALTAAQAATAFANLTATGDTQGSGIDANGVYTGSFSGWTTGAASGDTVVFTGNTAGSTLSVAGAAATLTTTGVSAVPAVAAKLGVTAGTVVITGADALKTVSVDGYSGAAKISGAANKALDTINLANGAGATIQSAAATLALSLDKVTGGVSFFAAPNTLNIKSIGNNTIDTLTAAATESLNVSGTGTLSATSASNLVNTKAIKVTETAGLNLTGATLTSLTSVDTTGTTGTVTLRIDSTQTTYAGGAGVDAVTLSNATTATKALDLGAGNDTLTLATGTVVPTAVLKGGAGDDTLSLVAADAVTLSASTAFAAKLEGFERLQVTDAKGAQTIDMGKLGFTNHVTVAGVTSETVGMVTTLGTLTLTDLASNATVALTGSATGGITANIKDAATGTADVLNLSMTTAANLNGGTLTAANVETVNITTSVAGAQLTLAADKATAVTVTGTGALNLTTTNSKLITSIDGSAMTGALVATSTNTTAATTIKGGAGNDSLTAATGTTADVLLGGAGNDTLTANAGLSTLTGGAGNDLFTINTASLNVNSYATVTDFAAGDLLRISGADSFAPAKVVLGATAVFQDFANAAINTLGIEGAGWFQFGGDTYVVSDKGVDGTTFTNSEDFIVKLTGLIDLSQASFSNSNDTIALV